MYLVNNKINGAILVALICVSLTSGSNLVKRQANDQKKVVCYYANWAVYRQGLAKFSPQNINPFLCTHLIYAFGGLQKDDTLAPFDKYQDLEKSGYSRFAALKTYNKDLKTMLAIGGWNEASKKFSPMVADPQRRNTFIKSAIRFLRQYNFDGIDLDWEYPTQRKGGRPRDRENYPKLVEEMREAFDNEADQTGKDPLIISMAVPASLEITAEGFDIRSINKNLDFFNILAYDYHSSFEPAVNHHSPLFRTKEISDYDFRATLNIDSTIKYYIGHGASPEKIVLGIPTYGRSYTLINPDAHEYDSPTDGPGIKGNGTKEKGYLAYYEICNGIKDQDWEVVNENRGVVGPYAHHDNFWVGYDDIDIVKEKAYYVSEEGLGGIMFWTIDNDDFRGTCHNEPYPLIEAAKRALYSSAVSVQSSRSDKPRSLSGNYKTTTPTPPTTPSSEPGYVCTDEGFFPHSKSCKKYYWCLEAAGVGMVAHTFTCPQGLFFNSLTDGCDFKRNVNCGDKSQTEEVEVQSTTTERNAPSNPNDKSVQDILDEIKLAGGLEAFEEQLQEEEDEKKERKQRTKSRNDDISKKTRNRFSQLLERKKPKISESSSSSDSNASKEKKRPGSILSRLASRRRNNSKPSSTSPTPDETPSSTPIPPPISSSTNPPPSRTGFTRNRNRPSFLRNKPVPSPNLEESDEENEVESPRNSQVRNRFRNVQRTAFLNRGAPPTPKVGSELGNAEPVTISSDSFRTKSKSKTVRRNFGRTNQEESEPSSDDQVPSLISTEEGAPSLPNQRSQNTESRNLAYVTIDRSRGRTKLSGEGVPDSPSNEQSSAPSPRTRDRENTVRDLEYVTIQRGVPSEEKLLSKVTPISTTDASTTLSESVLLSEPSHSSSRDGSTTTSEPLRDDSTQVPTTTDEPVVITTTTKNIYDEENILNITVFKSISETLRLPHKIFRPQSSRVSTVRVRTTTALPSPEEETLSTTTTLESTTDAPETTVIISTTPLPITTTTINKIQALINQRKQSGKNKFFLSKSRKDLEATNEINDSKSTSTSPTHSLKVPSFKRPGGLRAKFPRKAVIGKLDSPITTTVDPSSLTSVSSASPSTTERNGFVKPSRPTNRLFNKFISRGTIGKLSKEDKFTTSRSTESPTQFVTATRSTLRSFIPTRPFALRPSNGFKPIDLSAAPSKKSISQERSSLRASKLFAKPITVPTEAPTTTPAPSNVEKTTEKLTVGKILANLHGESTEKEESSTLRPKSFKPKFGRNKLREKLRHQLQEKNESNLSNTEEVVSTTPAPGTSLPDVKIQGKNTTPRRGLPRRFPQNSKSPRNLSTDAPKSSTTPSRFQPTPRRSLRNRFSPTSIGFSRKKPGLSLPKIPSLFSTTATPPVTNFPVGKVLSNDDIAEKLGLIPTPIPQVAVDEENVVESTTSSRDLLAGLIHPETESPNTVPTERSSIENFLKSAVVSSPVPKTRAPSSKRVPFFPLAPTAEGEEEVSIEDNFVGPFSRPSSSFTSRRNNFKKRGRKVKRRRGSTPSVAATTAATPTPSQIISTVPPTRRQFSRVPINFARQRNVERETTTTVPESVTIGLLQETEEEQVTLNEVEPKFRRRRPDFSRRRNLGKLSNKDTTDSTVSDSDFDFDITTTKEEIITNQEDAFSQTKEEKINLITLEDLETSTEENIQSSTIPTLNSTQNVPTSPTKSPQRKKSIFSRGRKPFGGLRRESQEDEENDLSRTTTSYPFVESTPQVLEEDSRIERRSTLSSIINEIDFTTEGYISTVSDFSFPADDSPSTTAQPPSPPTKRPIFSVRNRPTFLKSQKPRGLAATTPESEPKEASGKTSLFARTPQNILSEEPRSQAASSSSSRGNLFKSPINRPKLSFFQRKNNPIKAKETEPESSADVVPTESVSSNSSQNISTTATTSTASQLPSTTPIPTSVVSPQKDTSPFKSSKSRPPFKSTTQRRNPKVSSSTIDDSILDNSIDTEHKVKSVDEEKAKAQDAEESVEDAGSLEERLQLRLQQRKIKKSKNRNSLFKNTPRRPSFIRSRQSTTEATPVFVPTASSTTTISTDINDDQYEEKELDESNVREEEEELFLTTITLSTTQKTSDVPVSQIASTTRPLARIRPKGSPSPEFLSSVTPSFASTSSTSPRRNPLRRNRFSASVRPNILQSSVRTPQPRVQPSPSPVKTPESISSPLPNRIRPALQTSEPTSSPTPVQPLVQTPEPDILPSPQPNSVQPLDQTPEPPIQPSPRPNRFRPAPQPRLNSVTPLVQTPQPPIQPSPQRNSVPPLFQTPEPSIKPSPRPDNIQPLVQTPEPFISSSPRPNRFRPAFQTPEPQLESTSSRPNRFRPALKTPEPQLESSSQSNQFRPPFQTPEPTVESTSSRPNRFRPPFQTPEPQVESTSSRPNRFRPAFQTPNPQLESSSQSNRFRLPFQTPEPQVESTSSRPNRFRPALLQTSEPQINSSPRPDRIRPPFQSPIPQTSPQPNPSFSPDQPSETLPPLSFSPSPLKAFSQEVFSPTPSSLNTIPSQDQTPEPLPSTTPLPISSSSSPDNPPLRSRFQPQPRRLNTFHNRFQVSPSSPRPIISKTREENLFSKIQRQQNNLPTPSDKELLKGDARAEVVSIASTTTSKPTTFITTPAARFPPTSPRNSASRFRSSSRGRTKTRSRASTTTTTPAPEYEYYYDDEEYPEKTNGIGKLKSVDPIYDYELTPLSNKVSITSNGIECHDVGVFPHPGSCKKFITCSRRTSLGRIVGWEYECPIFLAFDPVGGRCNWAAEVECS